MTATVEIKSVSHRFGDFMALNDINLTINAGSFAVLLGPSGCGKTTLLSVLGGFLKPTTGTVHFDGTDVTEVMPAKRATTTMFQDYALFPHMNLQNNVGFGLRMRGMSKSARNKKSGELLALVGLDHSIRKKPHELSGGQRQRVALARALAVDPDVLLLDEPLGALDLKLRRQMQDELKIIQKRVGTTFIHVTHDQEEAMAIADQIIVMNEGRVEDQGTPESIYLKPKTVFSAAFMGEANLLQGRVNQVDNNSITVETDLGQFDLSSDCCVNGNVSVKDNVCICFRPEHVLAPENTINDDITLGNTRVSDRAFFGSHQRCQLVADDGKIYIANLPQTTLVEIDTTMQMRVKRSSIVVLRT